MPDMPEPRTDTEIAERLLVYLRGVSSRPKLDYARPPRAITGGFDTRILAFRLTGAPTELSIPLILRLYASDDDPLRARWESVVQSTVVSLGYPAPRVLLESIESDVLGGAFLVMERFPGTPMLKASTPIELLLRIPWLLTSLPRVLAEQQARLHSFDPEKLTEAIDATGLPQQGVAAAGVSRRKLSTDGQLDQIQQRIESHNVAGLRPALQWLLENHPGEPPENVICHGDFHPLNVLMKDGRVTGVVDWAMTVVGDPAFDVASTRVLLGLAPMSMPAAIDSLASRLRPILVRRYTEAYERIRSLDRERLAYYEALRCLMELSWVAEKRLTREGSHRNPWGAPREANRLVSHFQRIAGISPQLPPMH
ncbi:MAG: hypothetical protein DRI30_03265 [Chloroflexi bacterium]|nr:MAG: hypothetical protein DRI30_03265 [Chloroflexota bacterium]